MRRLRAGIVSVLAAGAIALSGCSVFENVKVPTSLVGSALGSAACGVASTELKPSQLLILQGSIGTARQHFMGDPLTAKQISAILSGLDIHPAIKSSFAPILVELSRAFVASDVIPMENQWIQALTALLDSCSAALGVQSSSFLESSAPISDPFVVSFKAYEKVTGGSQ